MTNIKLIIFDMDGVLIDAKNIHYESLNLALDPKYQISIDDHLSIYDGLKTEQKLKMISERKGLTIGDHKSIWEAKQKNTLIALSNLNSNESLKTTIKTLCDCGYKLAVCSNSIRKTVLCVLSKLEIIQYFDYIVSNQDVKNGKPHPEMYWNTMSMFGVLPEETLILEDSPHGLIAADRSKAHVLRIINPTDVTLENIIKKLTEIKNKVKMNNSPKWVDKKLNVLIPMAGMGSRFEKAGYTFPKPLIEVNGKPMIQVVVDNINIDANYIFVVQKAHREKYNLDVLLNLISPGCKIVETNELTAGAACTALLAKKYIDNDLPLFFANSDQYVEWDSNEFFYKMQESKVDGGIVTFKSTHPKWSFAKMGKNGFVEEVAEKKPISDDATVGFYYWKHGSDFIKYAEQMIEKNIRVNNEFYVCPVFNEAIQDGKKIKTFDVKSMFGIGTPEDLKYYLETHK